VNNYPFSLESENSSFLGKSSMTNKLSKAPTPAREAAFKALREVRSGSFAENAISRTVNEFGLIAKDRSLATDIVYGVLRWRDRLDAIIQLCLTDPRKKVRPDVRDILRIALYQALFLDRIPESAVVNEAALQAGRHAGKFAVGFVNAVLRSFLRNRGAKDPLPGADAESLALHYSHPLWLVERWLRDYGHTATVEILNGNNLPAPLDIRANNLKSNVGEVLEGLKSDVERTETFPHMPDLIRLSGLNTSPENLTGYDAGFFLIQSRASQMIAPLLAAKPGNRILDACAAPGGKTAHLAELFGNSDALVAVEKDPARFKQTSANFSRLGVNARLIQGDATDANFMASLGNFDAILADSPCSSLGILRHNPEVKYRTQPSDLLKHAELQYLILSTASKNLLPGGKLLYSVCSVSSEETSEVIARFLRAHPNFALSPITPRETVAETYACADGFFRTFPTAANREVDGFFAARILRKV
jgi:16S rRNA (cytosine967-C5)-methyltransferase